MCLNPFPEYFQVHGSNIFPKGLFACSSFTLIALQVTALSWPQCRKEQPCSKEGDSAFLCVGLRTFSCSLLTYHDVYMMYEYKCCVVVDTCKELELLCQCCIVLSPRGTFFDTKIHHYKIFDGLMTLDKHRLGKAKHLMHFTSQNSHWVNIGGLY